MEFNSYSYLLALFPAIAIFWALPVPARRWYVLALSLAFYASWGVELVWLPLAICGGVFWCARRLAAEPDHERRWLWGGIAFVLGVLGYFKYRGFALDNLVGLLARFGHAQPATAVSFALPLGISFYSFEAISFLIDTRQGRVKNPRFWDLALFVLYWPHLVAGPIVRVRELVPQLTFSKKFDLQVFATGLDRLLWGLVQKNVLSNSLGGWVDEGFLPRSAHLNTTIDNWAMAVAFGLQIYFDFASYSNMAIGTARLMGVTLPENFRHPYHAASPPDFWARWHMTLSRWIRDYLFFPLNARYQAAPGALYASLLGIMALAGLWHGAGWGFIVWGLLHGLWLVLYRIWESWAERRPGWKNAVWAGVLWRVLTLAMVVTAWVPFRASSADQVLAMLGSMYINWNFSVSYPVNFFLITAMVTVYAALEPLLAGWTERLLPPASSHILVRPLAWAACLFLFLAFDERGAKFIYFQF